MDDSNRVPTRPWPTDGVTKLFADATNHRDWRLCVDAVTQGQRAEKLLTRAPLDTDQVEVAQAALLKSFMMLTVHGSFRQAISPMTALEAYVHLCGLAPQTSIHEVAHSAKVKNLDSYPTPAAYVAAHRSRHDQLLSADASHYLASPSAYIADLLGGLPNTPNSHALTELYAYLPDIQKNDTTASRLTAAILRLPTSSKGNRNTRNSGAPTDRPRYGRRPGDPTVTNYSCMLHKMDNHKQDDDRCRAMQARRGSLPKPSAAAVTMDPEFVHAVAGSLAAMMEASNDQNDNVNNDSQYMISPLLDSAATHHLTASVGKLRHPRPLHVSVQLANHERATTTAVGSSSIMGSHSPLPLSGALCVPGLSRDLVSAGRLSNDFDITLKRDRFYVTEPSPGVPKDVVATGTRRNNVFMFDGPATRCRSERFSKERSSGVVPRSLQRLHDTFAHAHPDALRRLMVEKPHLKNLLLKCKGNYTCTPCNSAKLTRAPHRSVMRENCRPLHKLSSDTAGPLTQTTRGNRYFTVLADQATEYLMALPTRTKGAAGESLVEAVRQLQRSSGYKVRRLHSDGAGELSEGTPKAYAKAEGITLTKSIPNAPQMNGQSERAIRTLKSCIRTQLTSSGMPNSMWDYALGDCVAKLNAIPRRGSVCSPHHKLFGSPPRFPLRAPFGAQGFVPNKARKPSSLSMRGIKCRYLAPLSDAVVAVRDEKSRKIIEARGADFVPIKPRGPNQPPSESLASPSLEGHDSLPSATLTSRSNSRMRPRTPQPTTIIAGSRRVLRKRATLRKPARFHDGDLDEIGGAPAASAVAVELDTPTTPPTNPRSLRETRKGRHAQFHLYWKKAHDLFIDTNLALGAWELVDPEPTDKPVPHLWAYHYKTAPGGALQAVSARCTVRGDLMRPGTHFDPLRTAAQSPSHTARRLLYARAALAGEYIRSADVPNAYPRAPSDPSYRVTMQQPRRADGTLTSPGKLIRVSRAQMGSPDGGYLWERHRNACLRSWGWQQLKAEPSCFLYVDKTSGEYARLLADTDDFVLTSPSAALLEQLLGKMRNEWDVKEQRPVQQHMGIAITRTREGIRLSIRKHVEQLLDDFGLQQANTVKTPHDPRADLTARKEHESAISEEDKARYKRGVGLVRFIVDTVVYEAAYIASQLARAAHDPTARHLAALKRLARYLSANRNAHLFYKLSGDHELKAYADSDYAACPDTRRSRTGIAISYAGDLIFWKSVLQKSVTLSTGEAEYMAASEAARVIVWLQQLAEEWRIPIPNPTRLLVDNTAAIAMSVANGTTTRSKHIDTRAHYIQEQVQRNKIAPEHTPSAQQVADMFTKPLPPTKFHRNIELIRSDVQEAAQG